MPCGYRVDPLKLLDPVTSRPRSPSAPTAEDLNRGSLLSAHYQAPAVVAPPTPQPPGVYDIPADYDPLAPDSDIRPIPNAPGTPAPSLESRSPQQVTPPPTPAPLPTAVPRRVAVQTPPPRQVVHQKSRCQDSPFEVVLPGAAFRDALNVRSIVQLRNRRAVAARSGQPDPSFGSSAVAPEAPRSGRGG
jgi:hypothetical protein